ncbi:MAG: MFS transporter [Acidimicrobiales bacterium]|nr:MFS transporter [Acidimicrobiales bacterium]MDG1876108.1 MFS transporter [Acidimicrobiales bacterium]
MTALGPDTAAEIDLPALRKRTRWALIGSVFPAGMGMTATFAATSLAAKEITDNDGLATLAATMTAIGGAIAAVPLGRYMNEHGRRPGLMWAWLIGAAGAAIAFTGVVTELYILLVIGGIGVGMGQAASLAARYSAADLAPQDRKASEIGLVMWAGSIGSVLGPTIALGGTGWVAANLLGLDELAGPYLMGTLVFIAAAMIINTFLHPDPLQVAKQLGNATETKRPTLVESFQKLFTNRLATIAVFATAVGQGVMVSVMTVTPLHMDDGAHEKTVIGLVISLHVVGMYFFAPVVGWLVDRVRTELMVAAAGLILFAGAELASHTDPEDSLGVFVGLFLVGLGWSFSMIAGSALLSSVFPVDERASVQGAADFTMITFGATGGILGGIVVEATDYHTLSHYAAVLALSLIAAALYPIATNVKGPKKPEPASA